VTFTDVALVAETVTVDGDPAAMEAGLATMLTVGVAELGSPESFGIVPALAPPHPVNASRTVSSNNAAKVEIIL
jgi:hypothetical protein